VMCRALGLDQLCARSLPQEELPASRLSARCIWLATHACTSLLASLTTRTQAAEIQDAIRGSSDQPITETNGAHSGRGPACGVRCSGLRSFVSPVLELQSAEQIRQHWQALRAMWLLQKRRPPPARCPLSVVDHVLLPSMLGVAGLASAARALPPPPSAGRGREHREHLCCMLQASAALRRALVKSREPVLLELLLSWS
jgi:hypothetical protein